MKTEPLTEQIRHYHRLFGRRGLYYTMLARLRRGKALVPVRAPGVRRPIWIRMGSSDVRGLEGVFHRKQYRLHFNREPEVILDAGANIGLSAIYFTLRYPRARVIAVEPEAVNFELLAKNCSPYPNIVPVHAALWHTNEPLDFAPHSGDFGSSRVGDLHEGGAVWVDGRTIDRIMADQGVDRIDVLKVDIEGAEQEVFADPSRWIDRIGAIIIEIHDFIRPGCDAVFERATRHYHYRAVKGLHALAVREEGFQRRPPHRYRQRIVQPDGVKAAAAAPG